MHHRRRHNPALLGGFKLGDVFVLGGGALVGSSLSSAIPQWILGASNTGAMGYVGNFVSTLILTWAGGAFVRNKAFPAGILAGGIGGLLRRIIADYSLVGPFGSQLGLGDYMVSNWVTPQRVVDGWNSAYVYGQNAPGNVVPISSSGASFDDTLGLNDTGRAAGVC